MSIFFELAACCARGARRVLGAGLPPLYTKYLEGCYSAWRMRFEEIKKLDCRVFDVEQDYAKHVRKLCEGSKIYDFFILQPAQLAVQLAVKPANSEKSLPRV